MEQNQSPELTPLTASPDSSERPSLMGRIVGHSVAGAITGLAGSQIAIAIADPEQAVRGPLRIAVIVPAVVAGIARGIRNHVQELETEINELRNAQGPRSL